ncbi:MAG TPA: phage late control D family protein [Firmicutes bacterium]|nr:phage late control D family protein [Bacillota bacterium]
MRNLRDTYAPVYYIKVDGKRLPEDLAQRVTGIEFEDDAEKLPKLTVRFNNADLEITDHPLFSMGKKVQIQWGYIDGKLTQPFTFTVKAIQGFKVRELIAYGGGHRLSSKAKSRIWKGISYSDIASRIAREYGLKPVVEDTKIAHEQVAQSNQTDLNFLKELAGKVGFECYEENGELHFHPKRLDSKPALAFAYYNGEYGNLISFEPVEKTLAEPNEVTVTGIDPLEKKPYIAKANDANVERNAVAEGTYLYDGASGTETFRPGETGKKVASTARTPSEAKQQADANFRKAEEETVEASIETVGEPGLLAKRVVTLYGLGKRYSGNWYVKNVRHVIGQGYRCFATLERNATGAPDAAGAKKTSAKVNKEKASLETEAKKKVVYEYSGETGAERKIIR